MFTKFNIMFNFIQTRKFAEKRAEKIPDGPGVCELCSRPFENLLLHMADKHRVSVLPPLF